MRGDVEWSTTSSLDLQRRGACLRPLHSAAGSSRGRSPSSKVTRVSAVSTVGGGGGREGGGGGREGGGEGDGGGGDGGGGDGGGGDGGTGQAVWQTYFFAFLQRASFHLLP